MADIEIVKFSGNTIVGRLVFMITKKMIIVIFCLLALLGAALLSYEAFTNSLNVRCRQEDDSAKLAELQADLLKAASTGGAKQEKSVTIKQTYTGKSPKARST